MALWTVASTVGQTPCLKLCRVRIKFNHDSTCPCFFKCCSLERYTTGASVVTGRRSLSVADYRRERRPREGHGEIPTFYFVEKNENHGFSLGYRRENDIKQPSSARGFFVLLFRLSSGWENAAAVRPASKSRSLG